MGEIRRQIGQKPPHQDRGRQELEAEQPGVAGRAIDILLIEPLEQQYGVQRAGAGGRQRQPDVAERIDENEVAHHVGYHGHDADTHRRPGVLAGVITGGQHLDEHQGEQPRGGGQQARTGHAHLMQTELTAHEKYPQYGLAQHGDADHGWQAEQHHHAYPPIHGAREISRIRIHVFSGQGRQDHRADSHRKEAEGKLQQPVRVIEIADGTGSQERRQHGVDQQVDLADRDAEQGRDHQGTDLNHPGMVPTPLGPDQHVELAQKRILEQKLDQTAEEDTDRQGDFGALHQGRDPPGRRNHGDVEEYRREGGHGKTAKGIENGPRHGGEGDEPEVGEGDLEHQTGQLELLRRRSAMQPIPEPAPAKESRQDTGTQHPEQGDHGDDATQGARHRR